VIVKPVGLRYQPGKRSMPKIKHVRTADCVVAGFREHKSGQDAIAPSSTLSADGPVNGGWPASISYSTQPSEYRSDRPSSSFPPAACSGLM
jgi:ATP-dependent DNA ligase